MELNTNNKAEQALVNEVNKAAANNRAVITPNKNIQKGILKTAVNTSSVANDVLKALANKRTAKANGGSMFGSTKLEDGTPSLREQQEANMRSIRQGGATENAQEVKPTAKPKAKVARPKVIDVEKIVAERTPSLADNTPTPGETNDVLDNKIEYAIASNQPQEEESQQSLAHRIFNGIRKAVKGNDVAPTAEEELTAQTAQAEPKAEEQVAQATATAEEPKAETTVEPNDGLNDLFRRMGATDEQKQAIMGYLSQYQSKA